MYLTILYMSARRFTARTYNYDVIVLYRTSYPMLMFLKHNEYLTEIYKFDKYGSDALVV